MHKNFFSRSSIKSFHKEKVDNKARRPEITENISCAIRIDQKTIKTFFQKLHLITYEMQLRACAWGKVNVCGNVCDDLEEIQTSRRIWRTSKLIFVCFEIKLPSNARFIRQRGISQRFAMFSEKKILISIYSHRTRRRCERQHCWVDNFSSRASSSKRNLIINESSSHSSQTSLTGFPSQANAFELNLENANQEFIKRSRTIQN